MNMQDSLKIDTSSWKPFKIKDLFCIETGKDFIYNSATGDEHPVIGHGLENNGVACRSKTLSDYTLYDNKNTISMAHIGNYHAYIQVEPFYLGTRTKALKAKFEANTYIFSFITTVINFNSFKFSYNRVGSDKIPNEIIYLPVLYNEDDTLKIDTSYKYSKEGFIPDWEYMEAYMKQVETLVDKQIDETVTMSMGSKEALKTLSKIDILDFKGYADVKPKSAYNIPKLNISEWKSFRVRNIFNKVSIKKYSSIPTTEGDVPYISCTCKNNGVVKKVDAEGIKENCITVSTNGSCFECFYHDYPIVPSTDVEVLYSDNLNKYTAMFLCSILKQEQSKYSYGKKPKNDKVWDTIIKLPATSDGQPDWAYMENYIKSLPYGDRI